MCIHIFSMCVCVYMHICECACGYTYILINSPALFFDKQWKSLHTHFAVFTEQHILEIQIFLILGLHSGFIV